MAKTRSKRGKGSSKRRRRSSSTALKRSLSKTAAASAGAAIHTSHPTHPGSTLENFALLPYEIKTHVLELACSPPLLSSTSPEPESDADAADRSRSPQLDYVTTLNLTLVSTIFYRLVAPILFHSVCISRPSALAAFGLALQNHPQLGSLVRHLHVGPMDELPGSYAALEEREGYACSQCSDLSDGYHHPCTLISHSLQRSEETSLLPRWCTPNRQWDLDYPPSVSASSESVYQALREAQRAIDVDLVKGTRHGGQALASRFDWMERIWEVQAALDLCLMMMRRWEEDHATSHISVLPCDRRDYPPLVLLGYSMAPPSKDKAWTAVEPYVVTRSQLLRHLARRGSVTDRFDHPLLFARSGLDLELIEAGQEVERKHNVPEGAAAGTWASYLFSPPDSPPDYLLPSTATLGSLLSLLHSSLSRLHGLENLALSGFLELAICRAHPTPLALPSVRSLSIGPPAPHGFGRVRLDKMRGLQHLRLCGIRIPEHGWLDGVVRKLQSLQHVQTTPGMQVPSEGLQKLQASLTSRASAAAAPVIRPDGRSVEGGPPTSEEAEADGEDFETRSVLNGPLIEMKLHPHDAKTLLDSAPTAAVRAAWASGGFWSREENRLLIAESRATRSGDMTLAITKKDMYEEGRDWWEQHGGGRRRLGLG